MLRLPRDGRARLSRLGTVDALDLDRQRQLVIVRRDNIEHLLMIGGPNEPVIEPPIIQAESRDPLRDEFDPHIGSLGRTIGRGAIAIAVAQSVKLLSQFLATVVLSRLLAPREFGIVAMAWPILGFVSLWQDFGFTPTTIQRSKISGAELGCYFG